MAKGLAKSMWMREGITKKYQGIYDKAMQGRSPISAIRASCLICMSSSTKGIRSCTDEGCPLWLYRPYQEIPWKARRRTTGQNLNRLQTGKITRQSKKSPLTVTKDIKIPEGHSGRLRVSIELEPKNGK
ncbi:MAG: hypothetical protein ACYTEO_14940 [Planctomycetota bacterium]|jgi:hypothetical protein